MLRLATTLLITLGALLAPTGASAQTPLCVLVGGSRGITGEESGRMFNFVAGTLSAIDGVTVVGSGVCPSRSVQVRIDWEMSRANGPERRIVVTVSDPTGGQRYIELSRVVQREISPFGIPLAIEISFLVEEQLDAIVRAQRAAARPPDPPDAPRLEPLPPATGEPDVHLLDP